MANIGPNTRPQSFRFASNHWFASDAPERSRPDLPTAERDANHGHDPQLDPATYQPHAKIRAGRREAPP